MFLWCDMEVLLLDAFTIQIAGLAVRVQPLFQSTREYCRPYLTDSDPDFFVEVTPDDLAFQQQLLDQEAIEEGLKRRKFPDPFLERTTIQRRVADYLVSNDTLMLHGSTVAVDGKAYLFTAPCGTGKSTHTRLWRELFGERAIMVNDDKPFLQITEHGVLAYGSPWSGKHGLASNVCVPLRGICSLRRGPENVISWAEAEDLIDLLRRQVHIPVDVPLRQRTDVLLNMLVQKVPLWEMYCNQEPDAAKVAYSAMGGDERVYKISNDC